MKSVICILAITSFSSSSDVGCPFGWYRFNSSCYYISDVRVNRNRAQELCHDESANLISIHGEEENAFISCLTKGDETWIGLYRLSPLCSVRNGCAMRESRKNWVWKDATEYDYQMWQSNEPSGDDKCIRMKAGGIWADWPCYGNFRFLCSKVSDNVTTDRDLDYSCERAGSTQSYFHLNNETETSGVTVATMTPDTKTSHNYEATRTGISDIDVNERTTPSRNGATDIQTPSAYTKSEYATTFSQDAAKGYMTWEAWTGWTECSRMCGKGKRYNVNVCSSGPNDNCTKALYSPQSTIWYEVSMRECNPEACPVHGTWELWLEWTECSSTCGIGTRRRYRACKGPFHGGMTCRGNEKQAELCMTEECERVKMDDGAIENEAPVYTASDKRLSATSVGGFYIVVIFSGFALIVIMDIPILYRHFKYGVIRRPNTKGIRANKQSVSLVL